MSIRLKLFLIFLVIAFVPMLLLEIMLFERYQQSLESSQIQHLRDVLEFKANKLESYIIVLVNDIKIMQSRYLLRKYLPLFCHHKNEPNYPDKEFDKIKQVISNQLIEVQEVLPELDNIILLDPQGNVLFAIKPSNFHFPNGVDDLSVEQKRAFEQGNKGVFVSDVYFDEFYNKRNQMWITAPIKDFNDVLTGVLVFEIDMQTIYKEFEERTALGKTGESFIAKKNNGELIFLSPLKYEENAALNKKLKIGSNFGIPIQNAVTGKTGGGRELDYRGEPVIAAWKYLPWIGWGMEVKIDEVEAFVSVTKLRKIGIIIIIFIFLLVGVVAINFSNAISKPIKALTQGAQIIGSGNLDYKVGTSRRDEFGQLSRMFDKMTTDLKLTTASRDDLNREIEERKRTEQILKESEAKYRQLVQDANSAILRFDRDGNVTFFNEFAQTFFGYTADEILGKNINIIVPQEESTGRDLRGLIQDIVDNPYKYLHNVNENLCKDGRRVWMSWSNRPVFDKNGEFREILCVASDITDLKMAEEKVRESEQRYRSLFENMLDGYVYNRMVYDEAGNPIDFIALEANSAFTKLTGLKDILHKPASEVVPGFQKNNPEVFEIFGRVAKNGPPEQFVTEIKSLKIWLTITVYCTKPGYFVAIFNNFTERKHAEDALRISEERLQFALEACHIGAWDVDLANHNAYASLEHCRIFGYSETQPDWSLDRLNEHVLPEYRDEVNEMVLNGLTNQTGWTGECRIRRTDGEIRWIWFSGQYYKNIYGQERVAGVVLDITERKEAQEALRLERERLDLALYAANMGIWSVNLADNRFFGDSRSRNLLGKSEGTEEEFYELVHPKYREQVRAALDRAFEEDIPYEAEFELKSSSGSPNFVSARGKIERDTDGRPIRINGIVWDITERKKREEELAKLNRIHIALADSGQAMIKAVNEAAFMQEICDIITNDCGYALVMISSVEYDEGKTIRPIAHSGKGSDFVEHVKISWGDNIYAGGPSGTAVRTGKPYICMNISTDPGYEPWRQDVLALGYQSSMAFPLKENNKIFAVLTLFSTETERFSGDEINLLTQLANDFAYGITSLRARIQRDLDQEKLEKLNRIHKALSDSSQAMMHAENEEKFIQEICRIIKEGCGYSVIIISAVEYDQAKTIHPMAYAGVGEDYIKNLRSASWGDNKFSKGPTGTAVRTKRVAQCKNLAEDPNYAPWREIAIKRGFASSLALPLLEDDKVFGAITIYSNKVDSFLDDEIELLAKMANELAHGIILLRARIQRNKDQQKLEQLSIDLKRSNSELENFANIVSHDLREPLRAITGFMELLQIQYKEKLDEKANSFIEMAMNGGKSMRDMLLGLLAYSRVRTEGRKFTKVDMNEVVKNVINNLSAKISETQTEITHDKLPIVKGDEPQLIQLIQNLCQNAIKFMSKENPKIHIGCTREEKGWCFSVKDNGLGIDKQYHENIFMIFQRVYPKDAYEGTGVGLSVCKRIVERHNGQIWVESELGKGATFYFTIPD